MTEKWCQKCQERPCLAEKCQRRFQQLSRFGFLSAYDLRTDEEESEVHTLKSQLAAEGVDTGWPILPRVTP